MAGVIDSRSSSEQEPPEMDDPKSSDEERNKLVADWHAYGAEFAVFVPRLQPDHPSCDGIL